MQEYYIKKLLRIKDEHLKVKHIEVSDNVMDVHVYFTQGYHECPKCQMKSCKVHDYRQRRIKHGVINGYKVYLNYKRRRYVCKRCKTRFPEPNTFVTKFAKISNVTKHHILKEAQAVQPFKNIAERLNISLSTTMRHIDRHVKPTRLKLTETIAIDEFKKTNLGFGKYALIICDPIEKKVIDVMKNRRTDWLKNYFGKIPLEERKRVKNVIMDLWAPYKNIVNDYLPNARIIADVFHFSRYVYWAFNDIRIRVMNLYDKNDIEYRMLKKHWKIFLKSPTQLNKEYRYVPALNEHMNDLMIHDYAANLHPDLEEAFRLKDYFQKGVKKTPFEEAETFIDTFISMLRNDKTKEFTEVRKTFSNWRTEIINSFDLHPITDKKMTNGTIEGINNFIKVIKRVSYGFRDFNRFRSRILYLYNKNYTLIG
jgi:transposase